MRFAKPRSVAAYLLTGMLCLSASSSAVWARTGSVGGRVIVDGGAPGIGWKVRATSVTGDPPVPVARRKPIVADIVKDRYQIINLVEGDYLFEVLDERGRAIGDGWVTAIFGELTVLDLIIEPDEVRPSTAAPGSTTEGSVVRRKSRWKVWGVVIGGAAAAAVGLSGGGGGSGSGDDSGKKKKSPSSP